LVSVENPVITFIASRRHELLRSSQPAPRAIAGEPPHKRVLSAAK
jgi:hypothetical protein